MAEPLYNPAEPTIPFSPEAEEAVLGAVLTNELASNKKFSMVERSKLSSILDEQDLGASGCVKQSEAAEIGKMVGAQYLVTATVSEFKKM